MPQVVGSVVRDHRRKLGLKVGELARRVEISTQHLDNIEAGRRPASIELIHRLANELDAPLDSLLVEPSTDDDPKALAS